MKYVSIDIETTGLDPKNHHIIQIAAVVDDALDDARQVVQLMRHQAFASNAFAWTRVDVTQKPVESRHPIFYRRQP